MTEQNLHLLRQARKNVSYVMAHLDADRKKGELSQVETALVHSNLTKAFTDLSLAIKTLRDGHHEEKPTKTE